MTVLDYERLMQVAERQAERYREAKPFPHVVLDNFLHATVADAVAAEFEGLDDRWKHYRHFNESKLAITDLGDMPSQTRALLEALNSPEFVRFVERLTGQTDLVADPTLEGAGMHAVPRGGFLNVHADFQTHTKSRTWSRRVNLLLYLNRHWEEAWRGHLEIWNPRMTACAKRVFPGFNRAIVFGTLATAFHGHPEPLLCPEHEMRRSLALYYYRDEGLTGRLAPTNYRARPGDSLAKRLLIRADYAALKAYTFVKARTGLSDETPSRILKRFGVRRS